MQIKDLSLSFGVQDIFNDINLSIGSNEKVGIVGAKVMIMDEPELVQDFGCRLDFNKYKEYPQYQFKKEDETPEKSTCHAACADDAVIPDRAGRGVCG